MRYKNENRIQYTEYNSVDELISDVVSTITDESICKYTANVIANKELINRLTNYVNENVVDGFEFDIQSYDTRDNVDTYSLEILDDGDVYVDPAVYPNGECQLFDSFMFVEKNVDDAMYNVANRHCDVMVFDLNDF